MNRLPDKGNDSVVVISIHHNRFCRKGHMNQRIQKEHHDIKSKHCKHKDANGIVRPLVITVLQRKPQKRVHHEIHRNEIDIVAYFSTDAVTSYRHDQVSNQRRNQRT